MKWKLCIRYGVAAAAFWVGILAGKVAAQELEMTYLGTAGWKMNSGSLTILVDPYISRLKLKGGPLSPEDTRKVYERTDVFVSDTTLIDSLIDKADFILVHHSHFDHLSDVPYIARKTGAKVIGTETTCNILRAYGIPNDQLYTVKGGEDYTFGTFSVRVIPSIHSALNGKHYFNSDTYTDVPDYPLQIADFVEGGSLMFLIRFPQQEVLTMGSMNYVERELEGVHPDVLLAGVNLSRLEIYKYTERLLKTTGYPSIVVPVHWDNYRVPYHFSQEEAIRTKVLPFLEEVRAVAPQTRVIVPRHLELFNIPTFDE
ncbi:MAG: MBL fold metallo-hydrolase [Saprospiraceae bacterium]|jgi:L-ascorbate metabolism protein UlaG (beta-lactamase superfamily)|nr:MBL fold metallo-hydrolase [Saprospiraceae bacterium]MDP4821201.1 MBL fold metallo-hydrolase [Saprospiraceae bacterium]MDP4998367.1 MBL fold metallo-hydrolase [Saprospiraceae bacterium]